MTNDVALNRHKSNPVCVLNSGHKGVQCGSRYRYLIPLFIVYDSFGSVSITEKATTSYGGCTKAISVTRFGQVNDKCCCSFISKLLCGSPQS